MAVARRADGLLTAVSSAGRRAVGVPTITRSANREGLRARLARPQPERRFHEALAQRSRPRNAGTDAVAQWPTAVATGRTVESANEGLESQLRVLPSSQSPSTIAKIPGGLWTLPDPWTHRSRPPFLAKPHTPRFRTAPTARHPCGVFEEGKRLEPDPSDRCRFRFPRFQVSADSWRAQGYALPPPARRSNRENDAFTSVKSLFSFAPSRDRARWNRPGAPW